MQYSDVRPARFLARPNRFIAQVQTEDGTVLRAHVKNTGRCAELLVPDATVYLQYSAAPGRKTPCDLIAVIKDTPAGPILINMDSAAPNAVTGEWLAGGGLGLLENLRAEYRLGDSRFDFYAEQAGRPVLVEVKGCTLERDGVACFPDAPTLRGLKHVRELTERAAQGWRCCVLFVVQMKGPRLFVPNRVTQPDFADALQTARQAGVEVMAMDCRVTPDTLHIDAPVPVCLEWPVL